MKKVKILSTGSHLPPKVLTNFDLEKMVDTSNEWIATSDLAVEAAKKCLDKVGYKPEDVDTIIVATITPDMFFPSTACVVHKKLGGKNEPTAFDISAACSGFIYGLTIAEGLLKTGKSKNLLLIAADTLSKFTNWQDRNTCVLFGDGAGAILLTAVDNDEDYDGIISTYLGADGNYEDLLYIPAGGSKMPASIETVEKKLHTIFMSGKEVFKVAVTKMVEAVIKSCELAGIQPQQLDLIIPHQANLRIINAIGERLNVDPTKIFVNVDKYGNMSASTVIVGLDEAISEGKVKNGSLVCLVAFGGGFTWGGAIIKL